MRSRKIFLLICIILVNLSLPASAQNNALAGAGSTLAYPLLNKVFDNYTRTTKQIINYQANGSGSGMDLLSQRNIDFVVTDLPFTNARAKKLGAPTVYIPIANGIVTIAYNIPGLKTPLNLNAQILTGIYTGKIINWNDTRIAKLNPNVKLPDLKIITAHRSDDSGSTEIFTKYFKDDASWIKAMGGVIPPKWPVGTGVKSTQGIAGLIKLTPGAVGYVALPYAIEYKLPMADLQLKSGDFVDAGKASYPLKGLTGIMVFQHQDYSGRSLEKATRLVKLLRFALADAQKVAKSLYYRPLHSTDMINAQKVIKSITYKGKKL